MQAATIDDYPLTAHGMLMQRIPEPELMNDPRQARSYAQADFSEATRLFLQLFELRFSHHVPHRIVDLGCGPGEITMAFASAYPHSHVTGVDGAGAMLDLANEALRQCPELEKRVEWQLTLLPDASWQTYDTLISNSLLHHLHDPQVLWQQIRNWGTPGAAVLVMDLYRPPSKHAAKSIVEHYAADSPDILQKDFFNSLCAAFTKEEIRQQLEKSGLEAFQVEIVSDRHLAIWGIVK